MRQIRVPTSTKPVIFNFHSYPWMIYRLTYRRPGQSHIHVRDYKEKRYINMPLELAIPSQIDRFSLGIDEIDRIPRFRETGSGVSEALLNQQYECMNHALLGWAKRVRNCLHYRQRLLVVSPPGVAREIG